MKMLFMVLMMRMATNGLFAHCTDEVCVDSTSVLTVDAVRVCL